MPQSTALPPRYWHRISTPASTIGPWLPEGALGDALAEGLAARRGGARPSPSAASTRSSARRPGTSCPPAASGSGRCWRCWPRSSATPSAPEVIRAAVVCELTHLATLYHDDVMDEAAVRRGAPERQQPLDQQHRHPHRRPALRPRLRPARRPRPRGRAHPGADLRAAGHRADPRDRRPAARRRPRRPLPRACWPTRPARWSPPPPGSARASPGVDDAAGRRADRVRRGGGRRLPDLRRPARHPERGRRLREARPAPTCARASPPCRRCSCSRATTPPTRGCASWWPPPSPTTPTTPRPWPCCAPRGGLARATEVLAQYADRARARLDDVPAGEVRDALSALCDYVVTRTS